MKLYIVYWKKKMANCFDFRMRATSFDLHQLAQRHKLKKISSLFHSRSMDNVKMTKNGQSPKNSPKTSPKSSPKQSPKGSPTAPRRRFVRVVKNNEAAGEEYENPHIIRRYTQQYLQDQYAQREDGSFDEDNLPYSVSGHTILKKHTSSGDRTESPTSDHSPKPKHASFKEDVEIIEFDAKGKVKACSLCTHVEKLADSDEESSMDICDACLRKGHDECPHLSSESEDDSELRSKDDMDIVSENVLTVTLVEMNDTELDCVSAEVSSQSVHCKDSDTESIVTKLVSTHLNLQECERSRGVAIVETS